MWPALLTLASFGMYLATVCPTVWVEDSGELTSAGALLGVAHPPGYPLYCVLAKLAAVMLPLGSQAFRVNVASAVTAAVSVAVVYAVCRRWRRDLTVPAGLAAGVALLWAVSRTLWTQARDSEVYTLTALGMAVLWWVLQDVVGGRRYASKYLLGLIVGLCLVTHHTFFLLVPLLGVVMGWVIARSTHRGVTVLVVFGMMQLGVLLVLYLPLRSLVNLGVDWGDPESLSRLAGHVLRKQYGQITTTPRWVSLGTQLMVYGRYWTANVTPWLAWLPLAGGWAMVRTWRRGDRFSRWMIGLAVGGWLSVGLGLIVSINYPDRAYDLNLVHVFFVPSYLLLLLCALEALLHWWPRWLPASAVMGLAVIPALTHANTISLARAYAGYDYGFNTLTTLPPRAILFTASDNQKFTSAYLKLVESFRPDVTVYDENGCIFDHILGSETKDITMEEVTEAQRRTGVAALETGRPVFYAVGSNMSITVRRAGMPEGLISSFQLPTDQPHWRRYHLRSLYGVKSTDEYMLREAIAQYELSWAEWWFLRGRDDRAVRHLARASRIADDIAPTHNNLAIVYATHRHLHEAREELEWALQLNPEYAVARENLKTVDGMMASPP